MMGKIMKDNDNDYDNESRDSFVDNHGKRDGNKDISDNSIHHHYPYLNDNDDDNDNRHNK